MTGVDVTTIGGVDADIARAEGEGYRTVSEWRAGHEEFWRDGLPELGTRAPTLDDQTPLVVERFRLVGKATDARVVAFNGV